MPINKILVVDDSTVDRMNIQNIIADAGYDVIAASSGQEAIEKANNTAFGLASGVWTNKGSKIFKTGSAVRSGVMWSNTYNKFDPTSPFGGFKESGIGREGGLHGLYPYLNLAD